MRLITSLTAAAAALADHAANRLDTWVEHTTGTTDAPRETPLGFTPATGADAPDPAAIINAATDRGLAGEQRDRWLADVKMRLDLSTGGPWCTEERDKPTGRIHSPYGVIATGVTREADRDLIENARADLYGLLALSRHDDEVIAAWAQSNANMAAERNDAKREIEGMQYRERQVDMVVEAWDVKRGNLKGYDRLGVFDPETPAGRVADLLNQLCKARPHTIASNTARYQALDAISANLREYGLAPDDGDYATGITEAVRLALAARADALQQLRTIDNALTMHADGRDPMTMALKHPADTAANVADALSAAQRAQRDYAGIGLVMAAYDRGDEIGALGVTAGSLAERIVVAIRSERIARIERAPGTDELQTTGIDKGGAMYYAGMRDAAALAPEETIEAVKQAAAARIRAAADDAEREQIAYNDPFPSDADIAAGEAYVAGLRAAADLAEDIEAAPDLNVAHIDTVNGRAASVEAPVRTAENTPNTESE